MRRISAARRGSTPDRRAQHDPGAAGEAAAQEAHDEAVGHQERDDGDGATRAGQGLVETGLALEAGDADVGGGLARAQGIGVGQGDAGAALHAMGHEQERALRDRAQWLVPSSKVILFQTLYLPIGFRAGRRLTSAKVAAS